MLEIPIIAIVDDDEAVRTSVASLVRSLGYDVCIFSSAEDFLGSSSQTNVSCVIADVRMPGIGGMELLRTLRAARCGPPVLLITAFADEALRRRAISDGAHCLLDKPFEEGAMVECLHEALEALGKIGSLAENGSDVSDTTH